MEFDVEDSRDEYDSHFIGQVDYDEIRGGEYCAPCGISPWLRPEDFSCVLT